MTKIITYNLNGIRAALNKGFYSWLMDEENPDVICLQEIKANPQQFDAQMFEDFGYHCFWYPAQKKGYSGTALLSKEQPLHVEFGCQNLLSDAEGRCLRADFPSFSVMSVYVPSGGMGEVRQAFKMQWLTYFQTYVQTLLKEHPNLILAGDFNICHHPIDIHDPVGNADSSGFLPQEREWFTNFLKIGLVDSFRYFCQEPQKYTWWSYRYQVRARNLGWRLDYLLASQSLIPRMQNCTILSNAVHSDHCPVSLLLADQANQTTP